MKATFWEERVYFTLKILGHTPSLRLSTAGAGSAPHWFAPHAAQPAFLLIPDCLPREGPSHSQLVSSTAVETIAHRLTKDRSYGDIFLTENASFQMTLACVLTYY